MNTPSFLPTFVRIRHSVRGLSDHFLQHLNRYTFFLIMFLLLFFCSDDSSPSIDYVNPSTEVSAVIYLPGGEKKAAYVEVQLFDVNTSDTIPDIMATTNAEGAFTVNTSSPGIYNLWAQIDSLVLFQDSVILSPVYTTLRDDTLEYPSSLTGIVTIQCGHAPSSVTIQVMSSDRYETAANETGAFTLNGLAGGTYELLFMSSLDGYLSYIKTITLAPERNDTITDTIHLEYTDIPFVDGITFIQDTVAGIITISWNKSNFGEIQDYVIYKTFCSDVKEKMKPLYATKDTFFLDTIVPASMDSGVSRTIPNRLDNLQPSDTAKQCIRYQVAVRTRNQELGPTVGHDVEFIPRGRITTYFAHNVWSTQHLCGKTACKVVSINDTIAIAITAMNIDRLLHTLLLYNPEKQDTLSVVNVEDLPQKTLSDTLLYTFDSVGIWKILAIAIDNSDQQSIDTITVRITEDPPSVSTCNDTGVFCGTSVTLSGNGKDRFGYITKWEWKIGSEEWTASSDPEITFVAPETEQEIVCQLAAVDDDGFRGVDTVRVITSHAVQYIDAEGFHSLFIKVDGNRWACGKNSYGLFGDDSTENIYTPVKTGNDIQHIAEGCYFSLILKNDGTVWGIGRNEFGQLGVGPTTEHYPFLQQLRRGVQRIAAGGYHSLFLDSGGVLWGCGKNDAGQLGDGSKQNRYAPVQIMTDVITMAAGEQHTLILKNDGTLWACGKNDFGQSGDSAMMDLLTPVSIMTNVKNIAVGSDHSLILKNDGALWTCGKNDFGQLGVDLTEIWSLPLAVTTQVQNIAAGNNHSLFLKTDGSLWTCGNNDSGQLGNGAKGGNVSVPVQIMADVSDIAAGEIHSVILKNDGTVWTCGGNNYGQVGDKQLKNRLKPIRIIPFEDNLKK